MARDGIEMNQTALEQLEGATLKGAVRGCVFCGRRIHMQIAMVVVLYVAINVMDMFASCQGAFQFCHGGFAVSSSRPRLPRELGPVALASPIENCRAIDADLASYLLDSSGCSGVQITGVSDGFRGLCIVGRAPGFEEKLSGASARAANGLSVSPANPPLLDEKLPATRRAVHHASEIRLSSSWHRLPT